MDASNIPFYSDWMFWSFAVSGIAVFLSQIPPIRILLKPKKLDFEVISRVNITHKVGNPNLGLHITLGNSGGRKLRIKGLTVNIIKDGKNLISMPAQNYFQSQSDKQAILFVPFTLKPEEYWSHSVVFLNYFDRDTDKDFRQMISLLSVNIEKKFREQSKTNENINVKADERFVEPFYELFNKLFVWNIGEYVFELVVDSVPSSSSFKKKYRFTLFESDTLELINHTADYNYGVGLTFDTDRHIGLFIPITEHIVRILHQREHAFCGNVNADSGVT